ncbi:MAG: DUF1993 domain-containing protein [Alphaproteobacteria bacterium]
MPLTMHQASVPVFIQTLSALSNVLDKAVAHCSATGQDAGALLDARLAPDMMTLAEQVKQACHHATVFVARASETDQPDLGDTDTSFEGMKARIATSLNFISAIAPEAMDGSEGRRAEIQIRIGPVAFKTEDLLLHFTIPQVLFHATTAYDIVRQAGVELAKVDFLGDCFTRKLD